jgi:hypothetical protein
VANTRYLRTVVEDYVRGALHDEYGKDFAPKFLRLLPGGRHEFDAVSEDGTVVASVKSASGLTSGGRVPSGKLKDCIAELYFLSLVEARERLLVLTTPFLLRDIHACNHGQSRWRRRRSLRATTFGHPSQG